MFNLHLSSMGREGDLLMLDLEEPHCEKVFKGACGGGGVVGVRARKMN